MKMINNLKISIILTAFFAVNVFCAEEPVTGIGKVDYQIESVKGDRAVVVKSSTLLGGTGKVSPKRFTGQVIDIRGNNVGLEESDICAVIGDKSGRIIVCKSGKVFHNSGRAIGSATGTPPHLMYKNFIGSYIQKLLGVPKVPGATRRIVYCQGPCEAK